MTDDEIRAYLSGLNIQKFIERDRQEVQGYHETLELILDNHNQLALTENNIKNLHSRLLRYSDKDENHRGNYKKIDNRVEAIDRDGRRLAVIFDTTPAYLVDKEMSELVAWSTGALDHHHSLLVLANFVVTFLKIHPFLDGNGRLSRLLTGYWLASQGYSYGPFVSHEKLIEDSKADYYRALRDSQQTFTGSADSISVWANYFLNILLAQAQQAINLLSSTYPERDLSPKQLVVWRYLVKVDRASSSQISEATGVPRITISQVLTKLVGLGWIERTGQGRATSYRRLRD